MLLTAVASAARTTSADSGALPGFANANNLRIQLSVTAVSGVTPTLNVVVEDTLDGTNWFAVPGVSFTQVTAAGQQVSNSAGFFSDKIRIRWTLGGTSPSFTFSVLIYTEP